MKIINLQFFFILIFKEIQRSVLNGNLEEAIELTYQLFPGILERNKNLLFALKVRQFIEMINNATNTDSMDEANENENIDQENHNLLNANNTSISKSLTDISDSLVLNINNNIDNKMSGAKACTKSLQKNGFTNNSDKNFEALKSTENLNIPNEEAMGRLF